jgi:4'-phosphopantetheinyl transferase
VEWIAPQREHDLIAHRILSSADFARYSQMPPVNRPVLFHALWARKEALAKACGLGLSADFPGIPVPVTPPPARATVAWGPPGVAPAPWTLEDLAPATGYAAAAAAEGQNCCIRTFTLLSLP